MGYQRYNNREVGWIQFNARVLDEALSHKTPLLERVHFLQIFSTNLDEFFMKRVGGLKRQKALGIRSQSDEQPSPQEQLREVRKNLLPLLKIQWECWNKDIIPSLAHQGITFLEWDKLGIQERRYCERYFDKNLFPVLTPLCVSQGRPFPLISNLSSFLGLLLRRSSLNPSDSHLKSLDTVFARVKIPTVFPQWIRLSPATKGSSDIRLVSLRQIITHNVDKLFSGSEVLDSLLFRVTRNADLERDEEDVEDLLEMITEELKERRFAEIVRMEVSPSPNPLIKTLLKRELELEDEDIYETYTEVDFTNLFALTELARPDLKYRHWIPVTPDPLKDEETSIFSVVRQRDLLVQHPYESFQQTVVKFIQSAVQDPKVLAVKMTLYRTGTDSPFIPLLIQAAEDGKQVVCVVELKARFDEEKNIQVARMLEKAGVHVVYGVVGLKTHCKVILIVRQEEDRVRSYAHIGTGNYHASTSRIYTDFGLFTAKPEFTQDVVQLFHYFTGQSVNTKYSKLIIAPHEMKHSFLELIHFEEKEARAGKGGRIIAKMNSLEDRDVIEALYRASAAGVVIDLFVRGFCCLRPQVKGMSDNIHVFSIIGRFLEHSRLFYFQHGAKRADEGLFFMGSADWMNRNLTGRIEVITPVEDQALKIKLYETFQILLSDHQQAWELKKEGYYQRRAATLDSIGTHENLMRFYEGHVYRTNSSFLH